MASAREWLGSPHVTDTLEKARREELARPVEARLLDAIFDSLPHVGLSWGEGSRYREVYWEESEKQYFAARGAEDGSRTRAERFFGRESFDDALRWVLAP